MSILPYNPRLFTPIYGKYHLLSIDTSVGFNKPFSDMEDMIELYRVKVFNSHNSYLFSCSRSAPVTLVRNKN